MPVQRGLSKKASLFLIFVLGFLGAEVFYLFAHVSNVIIGAVSGGPFFVIWLGIASIATVMGYVGSYEVLRTGRFENSFLAIFLWVLCVNFHWPGWATSLWVLSLAFGINFGEFGVRADLVGITLLLIYRGLVHLEFGSSPSSFDSPHSESAPTTADDGIVASSNPASNEAGEAGAE